MLKAVYHVLCGESEYRELGAAYVYLRDEARRRAYLRKELEKLGYEVMLMEAKVG